MPDENLLPPTLTSDAEEAVRFLRSIRPEGFWTLTCIEPDGTGKPEDIETRSFATAEPDAVLAWVRLWNDERKRNIYWTVNRVSRPIAKKPSRDDVASVEFLHVDIDPAKGRNIDQERERIRHLLLDENRPGRVPQPTIVVDSGGGMQAFWRLTEPLVVDGKAENYEHAKRYNQQLEVLFGGDHCHNVDRIMRLPGTVNWPKLSKRQAGQEPRLAAVVLQTDLRHPISEFVAAPRSQIGEEGGFASTSKPQVDTSNVRRLASLDELPAGCSDKLKVVINMGADPDHPNEWPSRSECLFWVVCELKRQGVSDDIVYSILTDPDLGISKSVLEKGTRAERYALRQIERANESTSDPVLSELNWRHAVVGDIGGKCRVLSEGFDEVMSRPVLSYQTFEDFRNRYANRQVPAHGKDKEGSLMPLGHWWITHPSRRYYERVVFAPGQEPENCYNLWRGFACEARPGDCSLFLRHIRENICRGDEALYEYVVRWMAFAVQHPGQPGQVAIVMRGLRGVGKGVFASTFGSLFGRHFLQCTNPVHLVGQFNIHLKDTVVLFADEAFYAGDKRHEAVLKGLVTEEYLTLEGKFLGTEAGRNCLHIIMATNNDWVVPAGPHERRFLVLDVGADQLQKRAYFAPLKEQMKNGGREALLHMLLTMDLTGFDPASAPKTAALQDQKEHSLAIEEEWWHEKLRVGEIVHGHGWPDWVHCDELIDDFQEHLASWARGQRASKVRLSNLLKRAGCRQKQLGRRVDIVGRDGRVRNVDRPRVFELPPLREARGRWDQLFGGGFDWSDPETIKEPEHEEHFA